MKKLLSAVTLIGCTFALPVQAQSINPSLDDTLQVRAGPFFSSINSSISVAGNDFDLEDRLDDNKTTFAIFGKWRLTPRLHINFGYSAINREESAALPMGVPGGGINIPAGTSLATKLETSNLSVGVSYAFVKNATTEFGADAGVAFTSIKESVLTTVPGLPTVVVDEEDVSEPLPSLGLFVNHAFSNQWMLTGSVRWLGVKIGDLDATIWDAFGGIEFRPWKNLGLGAAYLYQDFDGTVVDTSIKWRYKGPFAYVLVGG